MADGDKPLVSLRGEVTTPPLSAAARLEAGVLLCRLQTGQLLSLPHSRPIPSIGRRCHELRIPDERVTWRIIYRLDPDAILVGDVFAKKTAATPSEVLDTCKHRFRADDKLTGE